MEGIGMTLPEDYEAHAVPRFSVRILTLPAGNDFNTVFIWMTGLSTLEACQRAYIWKRDEFNYGASQFGSGDVFDVFGKKVARVSYNGKLWPAGEWFPGQQPLAEAPK